VDEHNIGENSENNDDIQIDVKKELISEALSWATIILFAVVFAVLINRFVIVNATVPTSSMEGTIRAADRIIAFRLSYLFSDPSTFDIIVFRGTDGDPDYYVKRVIGVPGDTVNIINGQVFINGSAMPLRDDFVQGPILGNYGPYEVPEGYFFVLGDYRSNSIDSRHWRDNAFVSENDIVGRVIFRYHPGFRLLRNT